MRQSSLFEFKKSLKTRGATLRDVRDLPTLRKIHVGKSEEAGSLRQIRFTISTNAVDLDNDTVDQAGWDLSVFRTNPVVLWMHDNMQLPVGKCVSIGVESGKLKATVEFVPASIPIAGTFAEAVYSMCRGGFLSATSVGFLPTEFDVAADRMGADDWLPPVNFTKQKLLEFSIVTVPANSEALIDPAERQGATMPPPETQARALSAAAKLAVDATFAKHRRLAFLADQGISLNQPTSAGALHISTRRAPAGLTIREKSRIKTAREAMRRGLSTDEIRQLAGEGWITIPRTIAEALAHGWGHDDVAEARRTGLIIQ